MTLKFLLLSGLAAGALHAPLAAQEAPPPPAAADAAAETPVLEEEDELGEEEEAEEIVVTGQRERGAVIGDIPPEIQLDRRDIRSLGAGSISELLEAIAPQTGSGRGRGEGRPVVLLNGRRISGFAEIRDIPPETIIRVDILPEEVALKYGYRADQRVVNFVLRRRFNAVTAEAQGGFATGGGRGSYGADINYLRLDRAGRLNLDAEYRHDSPLFESERDILAGLGDQAFRTLLPERDQLQLGATVNRTLFGNVSTTLNATFDAVNSESFLGLRPLEAETALVRDGRTRTGHLGLSMNGDIRPWRWSLTANYDRSSNQSRTGFGVDDPIPVRDRARSITDTANAELVVNGSLFALPAGDVSTSVRAGVEARGIESQSLRSGIEQSSDLSRRRANAQANLDIPIASRRNDVLAAIGNLSANLNAEVEHFSDFGTLRTLGGGLNWSPIPEVNFIASVTDEDGAPSIQQLGDPVQQTPNVRIFDYVRGETADVLLIEGGNPNLSADNRRVLKLGVNVQPLSETDLTLRADYTRSRTRNLIASFPTPTAELEAAFPDRFVRDASGRLAQVDSRPLNFARADREELRWGINFSKPLSSTRPPPGAFRRARRQEQGSAAGEGGEGRRRQRPEGARAGGGPRFGGGRGGFGRGGRLQLGLFHTWRFKDEILIREGVPELDLLNGSAIGSRGGRPSHEIELQSGIFKNGFGARLTGTWQSGTTVRGGTNGNGGTAGDLRFSDFTTLNLRLFADLGQQRPLVTRYPWLRGTRVTLAVSNLLDSRLRVRDEAGLTPIGYQPDLLDPFGRSVRLTVRKLFF